MFRNFFRPDSALMITLSQITDCIFLSLFWIMGCVPVVNAGASFAALYDATYRGLRKGDKHSWGRFLRVFKENWKAGILPTIIFTGGCALDLYLVIQVWNSAATGSISMAVFAGAALIGVLVLGMLSILFPMLSRFQNSFAGMLKNTVLLAMANMPRTLMLGILNAISAFLCVRFIFPLFFLPSLAALIGSLFIEPMFKPYMPEEPDEEVVEEIIEEAAE